MIIVQQYATRKNEQPATTDKLFEQIRKAMTTIQQQGYKPNVVILPVPQASLQGLVHKLSEYDIAVKRQTFPPITDVLVVSENTTTIPNYVVQIKFD